MTAAALKIPPSAPPAAAGTTAAAAASHCPRQLSAANINPQTRLATDYLNHFNEAVMLLEMIPAMPECADDFIAWQPMSYCEHFRASSFKERDLAIAAYATVDPQTRARFDELVTMMTSILVMVRDAMQDVVHDDTRARLADQATQWLKPLVAQTGGVINGRPGGCDGDTDVEPQADVDYIMTH
ncbi:MAG: hypothetical protein EPO23_12050 [Xanthobacteraceae bacterium]|nr:MAG: hypothetical protein EPO23_12050 [Xanthobacteraceae bacterium]